MRTLTVAMSCNDRPLTKLWSLWLSCKWPMMRLPSTETLNMRLVNASLRGQIPRIEEDETWPTWRHPLRTLNHPVDLIVTYEINIAPCRKTTRPSITTPPIKPWWNLQCISHVLRANAQPGTWTTCHNKINWPAESNRPSTISAIKITWLVADTQRQKLRATPRATKRSRKAVVDQLQWSSMRGRAQLKNLSSRRSCQRWEWTVPCRCPQMNTLSILQRPCHLRGTSTQWSIRTTRPILKDSKHRA